MMAGIKEVAVVLAGSGLDAKLVAYVAAEVPPSLLALKRHCAAHLPRHMIVDKSFAVEGLPRTGNGKVDRKELASRANEENF
jgi:acyl-coenzyme A synthetase/AMP-(fatty) acid ligase